MSVVYWVMIYICQGMLDWALLTQLEKLANEAKVEGFGPCESLSFAVILNCGQYP